jgi:hypothetical protein
LRIAQPLLMAALVTSLGVANQLAREGIVICAIPTAVLSTLLAPRYRLYEVESSSTLVATALLMIVTLPTAIFLTLIFLASNQQKDIFPSEEQKRPNSDRGTRALCGVPGTFPDRRGFDSIEEAVNDARQDRA